MHKRSQFVALKVIFSFTLYLLISISDVKAQDNPISVQCGSQVDGVISTVVTTNWYVVSLASGDIISFEMKILGSGTAMDIGLFDPSGNPVGGYVTPPQTSPVLTAGVTGEYKIKVSKRVGVSEYTLGIGCTLRSGAVIKPGEIVTAIPPQPPTVEPTLSPEDSEFVGFPGLAPVDFSSAIISKLTVGQTVESTIPPGVDFVLGYTVDAAANDTLALAFTRLSGNLNLGLVVLSADNKVVFQASLVTSSELTTKFTLPTAGTYTIGVFRIDLLPPAAPEATAFQLTATLNP